MNSSLPSWRLNLIFGLLLAYALSTLFSMATMSVGVGLVALALFLIPDLGLRLRGAWKDRDFKFFVLLTGAILGMALLSLFSAKFFPLTNQVWEGWGHSFKELKKLAYFFVPVVFYLGADLIPEEKKRLFLRFFWLALAFLGVVGVVQHFTGWPRAQGSSGVEGRYASVLFMGLSLSVASVLTLIVFPIWNRFFQSAPRSSDQRLTTFAFMESRLGSGVTAFLVTATIFLTFSRMAWIALPIGFGILLFQRFGRRFWFFLLPALIGVSAIAWNTSAIRQRIIYSGGYSDRLMLWEGHVEVFKLRPVLGAGWRQNSKVVGDVFREKYEGAGQAVPPDFFQSHAHNIWIETLAGTGILGFVAFFAWNLWLFTYLRKRAKDAGNWNFWYAGSWIGFICFHVNGLTQVNFWDSKVFHQILLMTGMAFFFRKRSIPIGE